MGITKCSTGHYCDIVPLLLLTRVVLATLDGARRYLLRMLYKP